MGIRAFVSIPDVQNSRFRPILGQLDLTRRDQARFKPEEHLPWITIAALRGRFCWMWDTFPAMSGAIAFPAGQDSEPARIRAPILRSCRIASCETRRSYPRGSAAATTKISSDLSVPTVFLVPSFGLPLRRRAVNSSDARNRGPARQMQIVCFGHGSPDGYKAEESRGTAVDDKKSLVPSGGENQCTSPWIRIVSRNDRIEAARRVYQLRGTVKCPCQPHAEDHRKAVWRKTARTV